MEEKKKLININMAEVVRTLYADRKKVCIYSMVAGVIGVALAFGTPKVYKSTVTWLLRSRATDSAAASRRWPQW